MQPKIGLVLISTLLASCGPKTQQENVRETPLSVVGTWQLISGTTIENGDTTVTDYTKNLSFIKIINDTYFAFLKHNPDKEQASPADFGAGGGHYTLDDSTYTEQLEYCNDREWEGNRFTFTVTLRNDTLTQRGIEKVAQAGVNRVNIEQYVRLKR